VAQKELEAVQIQRQSRSNDDFDEFDAR